MKGEGVMALIWCRLEGHYLVEHRLRGVRLPTVNVVGLLVCSSSITVGFRTCLEQPIKCEVLFLR